MMNIRQQRSLLNMMEVIEDILKDSYPSCHVCYDREWIPVDAQTFIRCYGARMGQGLAINIDEKIDECSVRRGWCTCQREE